LYRTYVAHSVLILLTHRTQLCDAMRIFIKTQNFIFILLSTTHISVTQISCKCKTHLL